jgi:transcription-repair coupling factor (superfamily II helicase)
MNLSPLLKEIFQLLPFTDLVQQLRTPRSGTSSLPLSRSIRSAMLAVLSNTLPGPVIYVTARIDRLRTVAEELTAWDPDLESLRFPEPEAVFYEIATWGDRALRRRMTTLARLTQSGQPGSSDNQLASDQYVILTTARALMTHTLAPREVYGNSRWIHTGYEFKYERLISLLLDIGYAHGNLVTEPGQFSRRGGIVDVWPPSERAPLRLDFFGDEIETIRQFDPHSQRSTERIQSIRITPAREGLPKNYDPSWDTWLPVSEATLLPEREYYYEFFLPFMNSQPTCLLDFLPENAIILLDDQPAIEQAVTEIEEHALTLRTEQIQTNRIPEEFPDPYLTWSAIEDVLSSLRTLQFGYGLPPSSDAPPLAEIFSPQPRFGGQLKDFTDYVSKRRQANEKSVIVSRQASRLGELWSETGLPVVVVDTLETNPQLGDVVFVQGALSEGWRLDPPQGQALNLLSDAEIFGWTQPRPRRRPQRKAEAPEMAYADLESGDWVVHVDYGIGKFTGLVERTLEGLRREYLLIEYLDGDQLYVPIHHADRVSRYVGVHEGRPSPNRLGTPQWERAKSRAREAVNEVARDLLELYARRQTVKGFAFSPDGPWQHELEASFPYQETADQTEALAAVKNDMEQPRPMDRLMCGDVGYGKTEVALRAAFKAVLDGKQVAVLVPTTVLAQQHFDTFRQRLSAFPVEVEMLSRFRTRAEADNIIERLFLGEVDIVIGTHRLLQADVLFNDLGLLIIDEEQRFGVTHKEFLKQMRTEVDVLTLTATPIPRTLYMALTGARDISNINTPPEERLPVKTHVGPYDPRLLRQAILRELDRGGQAFFVHNRVQTIEAIKNQLEKAVPEARFAIGHGQMPEQELSQVMHRFTQGEIDVLVCTSIIESGLDIPNANTLVVDRAELFGLAQLYQLRGRVGRGAAQAYAYFFRHANKKSTQEGLRRLETIAQYSQLGAGYSIAMRDLEMRGAGDLLGTRQHGHIGAIGFHLYTQLLAQAIKKHRSQFDIQATSGLALPDKFTLMPVTIELPLPSTIPPEYIPERDLRLQLYRRLANEHDLIGLKTIQDEMRDRFGEIPNEVDNLFYQLLVKLMALEAGVRSITIEGGQILLQFSSDDNLEIGTHWLEWVRRSKRGLWLKRHENPEWETHLVSLLREMAGEQ